MLRYIITMIARPTLTSAAATTIIKNTNSCPSEPENAGNASLATACIFEKATNSRLTEFNISSMHINTMMAFLRVSTPTIPIVNSAKDNTM